MPVLFFYLFLFFIPEALILLKGLSNVVVAVDKYILRVWWNTFWQALVSASLSTFLAVPLAYIYARYRFRFKEALRSLMLIPFVTPGLIAAEAIFLFFGSKGLINMIFHIDLSGLILYNWRGIVLGHLMYYLPFQILTLESSFKNVDEEYLEEAYGLGSTPFNTFTRIVLPMVRVDILLSYLMVFLFSFITFTTPLIVGGGKFPVLEVEIYSLYMNGKYEEACSISLLEIVSVWLLTSLYLVLIRKKVSQEVLSGGLRERRVSDVKSKKKILLNLIYFSMLVYTISPLITVFLNGFIDCEAGYKFTIKHVTSLFRYSLPILSGLTAVKTMVNSIFIAFLTSMLSIVMGLIVAGSLRGEKSFWSNIYRSVFITPLYISPITIGLGLTLFYSRFMPEMLNSWIGVLLGHLIIFTPLTVTLLTPVVSKVERELVDAALNMGASRIDAFFDIELPLIFRGVLNSGMIIFASSVGEVPLTLMLAAPSYITMPVFSFELLSSRHFEEASCMLLLIFIIITVAYLIAELTFKRVEYRRVE